MPDEDETRDALQEALLQRELMMGAMKDRMIESQNHGYIIAMKVLAELDMSRWDISERQQEAIMGILEIARRKIYGGEIGGRASADPAGAPGGDSGEDGPGVVAEPHLQGRDDEGHGPH